MSVSSVDAGQGVPGQASADGTAGAQTRRARLRAAAAARGIPLPTILTTVGVVVLTYLAGKLIYRLRDILLLMVVAGFLAVILNPLVVYVQRGVHRRGWAVTIVTFWAALVFVGLVLAFGYPLVNGLTHLAHRLPSYVQAASHGHGWIGHLVRRLHLEAWVQRNAPKLQSIGTSLAKPALSFGKGAAALLATLGTIVALVLLLLLEGPRMRKGLLGAMSKERADRYTRLAHEINQSVTGYVLGDLATSVIAGGVVFVTLAALGVPFPLLWALWVALVDFLPMIGGALAGIPTVLFAVGHSLTAGIVTAAVFVGYQQLENHVLNPVIMSKTVRINPLLVLVSILVGSSIGAWLGGLFGGFVAALLSIPCAAALQVIVKDIWQATGPGGLLSDGPGPDPVPSGPAGSGTGSAGRPEDGRA
jgi:predicted PurR-regulated permease PerM